MWPSATATVEGPAPTRGLRDSGGRDHAAQEASGDNIAWETEERLAQPEAVVDALGDETSEDTVTHAVGDGLDFIASVATSNEEESGEAAVDGRAGPTPTDCTGSSVTEDTYVEVYVP